MYIWADFHWKNLSPAVFLSYLPDVPPPGRVDISISPLIRGRLPAVFTHVTFFSLFFLIFFKDRLIISFYTCSC